MTVTIKFAFKDTEYQNEAAIGIDFYNILNTLKSCDNREYNPATKVWTIEFTEKNIHKIRDLVSRERYLAYLNKIRQKADLSQFSFLKPFQAEGVQALIKGKSLLADSVGLGKTLQSISYCESQNFKKVLIACPAPLKRQWRNEIIKFFPRYEKDKDIIVLEGNQEEREQLFNKFKTSDAKYLIINYEQMTEGRRYKTREVKGSNSFLLSIQYDCAIFDEIHRIKNWQAKSHKFATKILTRTKKGLTATPIVNNPLELKTIANFLKPRYFNHYNFHSKFCETEVIWVRNNRQEVVTGYKNLHLLYDELKDLMIRRKKEEVLGDLPTRSFKNYYIKLTPYQQRIHDHYWSTARILYQEEKEQHILAHLIMALQACGSSELIFQSKSPLAVPIKELESAKLTNLKDILEGMDEKVVIFTQYKRMAYIINKELGADNCTLVTGDTKGDKTDIIEEFKMAPDKKYLIATDCLNYGINLETVRVLIHFDLPWSASKMEQREGRIDRMTQENKMLIIKLIAEGTIEERVVEVLENKTAMINAAIEGKDAFITKLIINELFGDTKNARKES